MVGRDRDPSHHHLDLCGFFLLLTLYSEGTHEEKVELMFEQLRYFDGDVSRLESISESGEGKTFSNTLQPGTKSVIRLSSVRKLYLFRLEHSGLFHHGL